jgi:hypothetical protein
MYPIRLTDEANKNGFILYSPFTNILKQNTNRIVLSRRLGKRPTQPRYYVSGGGAQAAHAAKNAWRRKSFLFLKSEYPFFILVSVSSRSLSRKKEKVRYVD